MKTLTTLLLCMVLSGMAGLVTGCKEDGGDQQVSAEMREKERLMHERTRNRYKTLN